MRQRTRGRLAYGLWCLAFVGLAGGLAWKFDWLPFDVALVEPETGRLAQAESDESSHPVATPRIDANADSAAMPEWARISSDPDVFAGQSEPEIADDSDDPAGSPFFGRRQPRPTGAERGRTTVSDEQIALASATAEWSEDAREPRATDKPETVESDDPFASPPPTAALRRSRDVGVRAASEALADGEEASPFGGGSVGVHEGEGFGSGVVPASFEAPVESDPRLDEIDRLLQAGETLAAHKELSKLWWKEVELRPLLQQSIDRTARTIYFSPQPHFMEPYVIQPGDQLRKVARQYQVPWEYLASLNQVDPRRIQAGQKLKVIKGPFAAVVDLGRFELTVHAHGYYVRRYPVGIGKEGSSPVGKFTVLDKVVDPQYTDPDTKRVIAPDDPENPLGGRWINLGDGYGIHGTIEPQSIGKAESRGCIRLRNEDVRDVYDLLEVGSEVIIRP